MKNIAVIGYGGQGAWHCNQIKNSDVVSLSGTFDIKPVRLSAATDNGIFVYDSLDTLLADKTVDAVVIATPNDIHEDLAIKALKSGKNVICEKPVTLSVASFDRIIKVAKEENLHFTVHQNRRWDVDYLAVKSAIASNEIGDTIRIESRIHGSRGIPSDWRCEKAFGGGMIYDWGVHLIDQMLTLIPDKIVSVNCNTTHITNSEVDDGFRLELGFSGGKSALVEVGTYNFLSMPRFYMQSKSGSLYLEDWRKKAHVAKLTKWIEKDVTPVQNAAGITKTMAPRDSETLYEYDLEIPVSSVHDFYRNFCLVLDKKAEPLIKNEEVRRVLSVIETAFLSAEKNQTVKVEI